MTLFRINWLETKALNATRASMGVTRTVFPFFRREILMLALVKNPFFLFGGFRGHVVKEGNSGHVDNSEKLPSSGLCPSVLTG